MAVSLVPTPKFVKTFPQNKSHCVPSLFTSLLQCLAFYYCETFKIYFESFTVVKSIDWCHTKCWVLRNARDKNVEAWFSALARIVSIELPLSLVNRYDTLIINVTQCSILRNTRDDNVNRGLHICCQPIWYC